MKIYTALILCAGFGKRLNPITFSTPKPLLKIKNLTLLAHCINLIINLNIITSLKEVICKNNHLMASFLHSIYMHLYIFYNFLNTTFLLIIIRHYLLPFILFCFAINQIQDIINIKYLFLLHFN